MSDMIGIVILIVFILALVGLKLFSVYREKKREASYPKEWENIGTPPDGLYVALQVIRDESPIKFERWGGIIEWVDGPFYCGSVYAAGCLNSEFIPHIKLTRFDKIEKTALTHEIAHIIWIRRNKDYTESKEFYDWINATNAKIAKQLGRA